MKGKLINLINIPQRGDARGGLAVAEIGGALPFPVRRAYWIFGCKPGASRGFHAHKKLRQLCICMSGSVRFRLSDGKTSESVVLNSPTVGLFIGPGLWREMHDFAIGTVVLVLADSEYDESDYIRSEHDFISSTL